MKSKLLKRFVDELQQEDAICAEDKAAILSAFKRATGEKEEPKLKIGDVFTTKIHTEVYTNFIVQKGGQSLKIFENSGLFVGDFTDEEDLNKYYKGNFKIIGTLAEKLK